jgi:hypothetical protein
VAASFANTDDERGLLVSVKTAGFLLFSLPLSKKQSNEKLKKDPE